MFLQNQNEKIILKTIYPNYFFIFFIFEEYF